MKLHSEKIQYEKYNWNFSGDLKVTDLSAWFADWQHIDLFPFCVGRIVGTANITSKTLSWTKIGYQGQKDVVNTP